MSEKVSIKEIAARANVSIATVSYVLNGTRNVRSKTKERVLQVIEELHYQPNDIAKSLKSKKTNTIGVIAEDMTVFNVPEIIDGINDYAESRDLHILLMNLRLHKRVGHNYSDLDAYRKYAKNAVSDMLGKRVEGIIYVGIHPRDVSGLIEARGTPIVYAYCYTQNEPSVQYNDERASFDSVRYLAGRGHRRIAVITGLMDSTPSRMRFNGYYKAIMENELPFDPQYIKVGDWGLDSGYQATMELLGLPEAPTAIVVMNDVMAVGALRAAEALGIRVPEELSVIGFDNREFSDYLKPRLTTMDVPLHEMGVASMKTLLRLIQGEDAIPEDVPPCRLIERESVAPPR